MLLAAALLAGALVVGLARATVPNNITQAFILGGNSTVGVTSDLTYVYWANNGDGTIGRANLDGTNVNQAFITGASGPITVAVDASFIYWVNQNNGTIGRANINGTGVNQSFITGASTPWGVAVNSQYIYWTNNGSSTVGRANLDGTGVNQSFVSATGPAGLAIDPSYIYWATNVGSLGRANIDGTGANQSFITGTNIPLGVAVDGPYIYWANALGPTIGRANIDGTGVNQSFISAAAVRGVGVGGDATHLYWSSASNGIGRAGITEPDVTPPVITNSIIGTAGTNGWYTSNVIVDWFVDDFESAPIVDSGCGTQSFTSETASTISACAGHSTGGSSSDSLTVKIDKTAPTISMAPTTSPNGNGWFRTNVTIHFTCSDAGPSGLAGSCPANQILSSEGPNVTSTPQTVSDNAGNTSASSGVVSVRIDKTPPTISAANLTLRATGSQGEIATFAPTVHDALDASPTVACSPASGTRFPVGTTTVTCTATDAASNAATTSFTVSVNDTTAPTLTVKDVAAVADDRTGTHVSFAPTAADDVSPTSPAVTCAPASGSLFAVGTTTVTCQATDDAGNAGSAKFNVVVSQPVLTGDFTINSSPLQYGVGYLVTLKSLPAGVTGTAVLSAGGAAVCTISFSAGSANCPSPVASLLGSGVVFTAVFSASGWDSVTVQHSASVVAGTPKIVVTAPPADVSVTVGSSVSLSASVTAASGPIDGGSVVFTFGGAVACTADVKAGVASCSATPPGVGGYPVDATFSGTSTWASVHASGSVVTAVQAPVTTAVGTTTIATTTGATPTTTTSTTTSTDTGATTTDATPTVSTTTTDLTSTDTLTDTDTSATTTDATTTVDAPAGDVDVEFSVRGTTIDGTVVVIHAKRLKSGTVVFVVAHSTPVTIATATVGADGSVDISASLPASLDPGGHHLIVNGTLEDGRRFVRDRPFSVTADHMLGKVGAIPKGILATLPVYVTAHHVAATLAATTAAVGAVGAIGAALGSGVMGGAVGGGGAGGSAGRRRSVGYGSGGAAAAGSAGGGNSPDTSGLVGIETERVGEVSLEDHLGDRSWTWRWPWTAVVDHASATWPTWLARFSPMLARVAVDGDYLRAMLGSAWTLLLVPAIALGVVAAHSTGGAAVPPSVGLFAAILALSVFDSLIGLAASLAFLAYVALAGGVQNAACVRELMAIALVWFSLPLGAAAARPLRRRLHLHLDGIWERGADVVIGALFAAWIISQMSGALSGLIGFETPVAHAGYRLALWAMVCVAARVVFETIVVHAYPGRLARVGAETSVDVARLQPLVSQATSIAVFIFFAIPYMGNSLALYVGTVICFSPLILERVHERLPKSSRIAKVIPQGLAKWAYIIFSGIVAGKLLSRWVTDPAEAIRMGFLLLPLPLIAIAVLEYFAAEDEEGDAPTASRTTGWMWRLTGTAVLVACVYATVAGV